MEHTVHTHTRTSAALTCFMFKLTFSARKNCISVIYDVFALCRVVCASYVRCSVNCDRLSCRQLSLLECHMVSNESEMERATIKDCRLCFDGKIDIFRSLFSVWNEIMFSKEWECWLRTKVASYSIETELGARIELPAMIGIVELLDKTCCGTGRYSIGHFGGKVFTVFGEYSMVR